MTKGIGSIEHFADVVKEFPSPSNAFRPRDKLWICLELGAVAKILGRVLQIAQNQSTRRVRMASSRFSNPSRPAAMVSKSHTRRTPMPLKFAPLVILVVFLMSPSVSGQDGTSNEIAPYLIPVQHRAAVSKSTVTIAKDRAIVLAQRYLKIEDIKQYDISVEESIVTSETYNTYRRLEKGVKREAWVVTFSMSRAVGASRTVYVDKETGEVLGGFSSK